MDDFIDIFQTIIGTINPIISSQLDSVYQLKSKFETYYNIDIDEVIGQDALNNQIALIYMGENYSYQTNDRAKHLTTHEMIVVIGSKRSLEIARIMKNNLGGFESNGTYYSLETDFITPMSTTNERFFKTAMGIYATE